MHPTLIIDWKNKVGKKMGRQSNDVVVLKVENGKIVSQVKGDFSEEKLKRLNIK